MSLAVLHSRALAGLNAPEVTVEVHLANGLPSFTIVGLPDTEVKESRDRVRAALVNSRFEFPARRITVNLAPAELRKESGRFDLPIALGILAASPAKDLEKNLRALLTAAFARLDLATREQFEVQTQALSRTREKLAELERRVVELEARLGQK